MQISVLRDCPFWMYFVSGFFLSITKFRKSMFGPVQYIIIWIICLFLYLLYMSIVYSTSYQIVRFLTDHVISHVPFFAHLLQKTFLLFLSTTLWGVDCERKNSAYVASSSLQRFHTCSACKIMFEMSITTSSLMFTWILLELTGEATKREGKRQSKILYAIEEKRRKSKAFQAQSAFAWFPLTLSPATSRPRSQRPMRFHWQLRCPLSKAVDGSWEEVTDKLEVNQPTAAWLLEM